MSTITIDIYYKKGDEFIELVSLEKAAKRKGVSLRTIRNAMDAGELSKVKVNNRVVCFDAGELGQWKPKSKRRIVWK